MSVNKYGISVILSIFCGFPIMFQIVLILSKRRFHRFIIYFIVFQGVSRAAFKNSMYFKNMFFSIDNKSTYPFFRKEIINFLGQQGYQ